MAHLRKTSRRRRHPRVRGDPVRLPRPAAVVGERLLEPPRAGIDRRDHEPDQDRPAALDRVQAEELAAAVLELADGGRGQGAAPDVGEVEAPLTRFGIVETQAQPFDAARGPGHVKLDEVGAPVPDLAYDRGALVLNPRAGARQRMLQTLQVRLPAADLPVEVVLRLPSRPGV